MSDDPTTGHSRYPRLRRVGVIAVLAFFVLVVFIVFTRGDEQVAEHSQANPTLPPTGTPALFAPAGGPPGVIRVASSDSSLAPDVVVTVVEDYLCENCAEFAQQYRSVLREVASVPGVVLEFVPIAGSGTEDARRVANASLCVAADTLENWVAYRTALFAAAPLSASHDGLTDDRLVEIAHTTGASHAAAECILGQSFIDDVDANTLDWVNEQDLPLVLLDGSPYPLQTPDVFAEDVRDAVRDS
ncbi:thioredoxin domain-containing protein [Hoyosella rhizosphaerae]|uniref:Thioredoxin-like fold domain-containing protein n=1 Tax=Hoyosella rhizosphaerae TaxID=1755582 RepID=A0A916U0Z7_9ACTN|nr:thioredoxin domain-containing protein [Hoyosella rhizosphaerae]MBN4927072.1 thioredoxin domain-containing protein [Hoyosella rhizosphaerae]GGC54274.1 hypothetical protein GCM10011410_03280 [Hoyosella rhizosphaerae]